MGDDINSNESSEDRRHDAYYTLFKQSAPESINTFCPFAQTELAMIPSSEMQMKQFNGFLRLTNKRQDMLKIKNEIEMFRAIRLEKLAKAMGYDGDATKKNGKEDEEDDGMEDDGIGGEEMTIERLNRELIRLKCRMRQNKKEGNDQDAFTFYVKDGCVYMHEMKASQLWKYSDYFLRNIQTVTEW